VSIPLALSTRQADSVVVLDFETTGLSPNLGDRTIEIGAVRLKNGQITDKFQSLMNPGIPISSFIESFTGISNEMLADAPSCKEVMNGFMNFLGETDVVAHNASFDRRFLESEMSLIQREYRGEFICSMLTARRVYQDAPNHRLGTLVAYKNISNEGVFHRALADAEMTALLWLGMLAEIKDEYGFDGISVELVRKLSRTPKKKVDKFLTKQSAKRE
jgi:DNA polymerase-3 subunit epsilon